MKIRLAIFCFIVLSLPLHAQRDNEIDSLLTVLRSSQDLDTQINAYIVLSVKYHNIDLSEAKVYAKQALMLSRNSSIDSRLGDIYRSLGDIAIKQDSLDVAKYFYELAYEQFRDHHSPEELADILIVLGNVEYVVGQFADAMDYYLKASEISSEYKLSRRLSRIYLNIGAINNMLDNATEAIDYFSRSLDICIEQNDTVELPLLYHNLGLAYQSLNDTSIAQTFFNRSLNLYKRLDNPEGIARSYINLAEIEQSKGNIQGSFRLTDKAFEQFNRPNQFYAAPISTLVTYWHFLRGENYFILNELDSAHSHLMDAFKLANEIKQLLVIALSSEKISEIWQIKGNSDSALYYHHIFHSYSDSLSNIENIKKLAYLESKYKFEQKINQEKEARIREVSHENRKYRVFLFISTGLLMVVVMMILILFLLRKRAKKSELKHAKLREELKERNRELATHVMYQLQKNEFILTITKKLQEAIRDFKPDDRVIIERIISDLEHDSNDNTWKEFEIRFHRVHQDFNKKLLEQFPDLSTNDLRLCAFIRLNLNTKEISAITYQSVSSIDTARFRLKQKLGLGKEENLIAFLSRF